ncbi:autotransporter domain-containing protein [Aurantimonas aggregata]|uniref:Autotransporter domain-containing protein n=1 Tax=Aurantimonas aggregata TaxID=2047720 RepID=A0A6L9MLY4_9HYPH|nr:autotransporter domain-containing protein [Aurantimonas aggregata]NDV88857.1 autotransporter domain-containing protein [Aurantimonas aggregata]
MTLRCALTATAAGLFAFPAQAAEPFAMQAEDVVVSAPAAMAAPAPFQMLASDITYDGTARADGAMITRNTDESVFFRDEASAADAQIVLNEGGAAFFEDRSTAETALLTVNGEAAFSGSSTAGNASIVTNASGQTRFTEGSNAGAATIENNGTLNFVDAASAGAAGITNNFGGNVAFAGDANAGGGAALTNSGTVRFTDQASANDRFIANNATGEVVFEGAATAGAAVIGNSGSLRFAGASTLADGRIIGNRTGTIAFSEDATAGAGEISHAGVLSFTGRSSAGSALVETLTGGATYFSESASGARAEIRLQDGAVVDFSGITTGATSVASLLGTGQVFLGGIALTVGDDGPQRTIGGISDGGVAGGTGGSLIKVGTAVLGLEGVNNYTGATDVRAGTLLGAAVNAFAPGSAVTVADGALLDIGGFAQEIGSLAGAGRVDLAANTLTLGGDNRSTVFSGTFTGAGGFAKQGDGTFTVANTSVIFGASQVTGGTLLVAGGLPLVPLSVFGGGTVTGGGTVGSLALGAGGTLLAAGPSLQIVNDLTFAPAAIFAVVPSGMLTPVVAGGTASLGGASVVVTGLDPAIPYEEIRRRTILIADAVTGTFREPILAGGSAFLIPSLEYGPTTVSLILDRLAPALPPSPGAPLPVFVAAAQSANQFATAQALDGLSQIAGAETLPLYNAVLFSDLAGARSAFEQLSGEVHAAVRGALVDGSRHARDAVASRVDTVMSGIEQGSDGARSIAHGPWAYGYGSIGEAKATDGAASADREVGGVFLGGDIPLTESARLGLFGGYGHTRVSVDARGSSASIDTAHIGAYGAGALGPVEALVGAAYSWNDVDTQRAVSFAGFADSLSANYSVDVSQIFGEIGHRIHLGGIDIKPFAGIAHVHLESDSFAENGGAARLNSGGGSSDTLFTTLGVRGSGDLTIAGVDLSARGMVGWRHASGDRTPVAALAFGAGQPFTVQGVPISRDAAIVEASVSTIIAPNVSLSFDYLGQIGTDATDSSFRVGLNKLF